MRGSNNKLSVHPIVVAIRHGNCADAIKRINPIVDANEEKTAFLAGRMLDEGMCVRKDAATAADYYTRAGNLGNREARFDLAAGIGLGDSGPQSYEFAGQICRTNGLDVQHMLSDYALGYAGATGKPGMQRSRRRRNPMSRGLARPLS